LNDAATAYGVLKTIRHSQPPRSYALHVRRFLLVWLATLPIALGSSLAFAPFGAACVVGAIAWALYSTDELAYLVGQPFDKLLGPTSWQQAFFGMSPKTQFQIPGTTLLTNAILNPLQNLLYRIRQINEGKKRGIRLNRNSISFASSSNTTSCTSHDEDSEEEDEEFDYKSYEPSQPPEPSNVGVSATQRYRQVPQTTFPLDEWADFLVTAIRQHVLVHSVLDRRVKSRTWVVKPESCVQKPIDEPIPYEPDATTSEATVVPDDQDIDQANKYNQTDFPSLKNFQQGVAAKAANMVNLTNSANNDDDNEDDDVDESDPIEPDIV